MLKNKKINICFIVLIAVLLGVVTLYKYVDSGEKPETVSISKLEQESIDNFYKDDYGNISKGDIFDVKYVYFDPMDVGINEIEIVKKKQIKVEIDQAQLWDEKGNLLCDVNYLPTSKYNLSLDYPELFLGLQKEFKLYGKTSFSMLNFTAAYSTAYLKKLESNKINRSQNDIILVLKINGKEEKYHLSCDVNKQFEIASKYKESLITGTNKDIYAYEQVNYYFAYLMQRDFDQWFEEIKLFLFSDLDKNNIDGRCILRFFGNENNKEELQKSLELDDSQFEKYLEIFNLAKEKGVIKNIPKYLKE